MAETKFKAGKKEELKWLVEHLDSNDTSTSTIVAFCAVMSEYFSDGWSDDFSKSAKSWENEIFPKLSFTLAILQKLCNKSEELENIFPKSKLDEQKYAALLADMNALYIEVKKLCLSVSAGPNTDTNDSFERFSKALKSFARQLTTMYRMALTAATVVTQLNESGLTLFHFNSLQHYRN